MELSGYESSFPRLSLYCGFSSQKKLVMLMSPTCQFLHGFRNVPTDVNLVRPLQPDSPNHRDDLTPCGGPSAP